MKKIIILILTICMIIGLCSCDPYADDIEAMQRRIAELELQLEETEESNTTERAELEAEIGRLKERISGVEGRITTLEALTTEINSLKERVERLGDDDEDIIASIEALADIVEDYGYRIGGLDLELDSMYTSLGTDLLTVKESILNRVRNDEENLKKIADELSAKIEGNSELLGEVGDDLEAIREILNKIEGRTSNYYHINPTTGEVEAHDFGDGYVKNSSGHYRECETCGYKTDVAPHYYLIHKTNLDHQHYCEDCGYIKIDEPHSYTFTNFDTTEEEWYEDYPTLTDYHVRGTIGSRGSWANIYFPSVPNLRRDTSVSIFCDECGEETYKVVDDGAGTGEYLLTYAHTVTHEVILEDTGECVLRIGDMDGKRYIYLRNYSVSAYNGNLMMHKWEVVDNTYREYGFEGQTWSVVDEAEVGEDKNIFKCADWNGVAPWGTLGYIIEGDIYYIGFGNGYRTSRVGFLATESGWVETEYGDDYHLYEELY